MQTCNSCDLKLATERYIEGSCGDIFCNKCIYINNNFTAFCPLHYHKISIVICNMDYAEDGASFSTDSSSDKSSKTNCKETILNDVVHTVSNKYGLWSLNERERRLEMEKYSNESTRSICQCKFSPLGCAFQGYRLDILKHEQDYATHQILLLNAILQQNLAIEDLKTDNRMLKNAFNHCSDLMDSKSSCSDTNTANSSLELSARAIGEIGPSPLEQFKDRNFYKLVEFVESEEQRSCELNEFKERLGQLENLQSALKSSDEMQTMNFEQCRKRLDTIAKDVLDINNKFVEYFERFAKLEKALASQKIGFKEKWDELNELEKCFDELDQTTELIKRKQQEHEDKLLSLTLSKVKINEVLEKQENKIIDFVGKLTSKSTILTNHMCTYVWRIENFSQKQEEVKSGHNSHGYVCSYPFYTSEYGYKMTLNLDPNGFGSGNGTHLSCFLHIMKSPMDAILKWPVEYSARFTLIDQLNKKLHHSSELYVSFLQHSYKDAVSRPLSDENPGCGIHQFIELNRLKPLYLVDDTIFLMVEVKIKM